MVGVDLTILSKVGVTFSDWRYNFGPTLVGRYKSRCFNFFDKVTVMINNLNLHIYTNLIPHNLLLQYRTYFADKYIVFKGVCYCFECEQQYLQSFRAEN